MCLCLSKPSRRTAHGNCRHSIQPTLYSGVLPPGPTGEAALPSGMVWLRRLPNTCAPWYCTPSAQVSCPTACMQTYDVPLDNRPAAHQVPTVYGWGTWQGLLQQTVYQVLVCVGAARRCWHRRQQRQRSAGILPPACRLPWPLRPSPLWRSIRRAWQQDPRSF